MKQELITITTALMMFCVGNALTVELREIIINETQNTAYVYDAGTGQRISNCYK